MTTSINHLSSFSSTDSVCPSIHVIQAREDSDGVVISGTSGKHAPYVIGQLYGYSLPVDCESSYDRCGLGCEACDGDDAQCCMMPVTDSLGENFLSFLKLRQPRANSEYKLIERVAISTEADCIAAHTYSRPRGLLYKHFAACLNTTGNGDSYLWLREYSYNGSNISESSHFRDDIEAPDSLSRRSYALHIDSPLSLSQLVYLDNSSSECLARSNLFFSSNGTVVTTKLSSNTKLFQESYPPIPDCSQPLDVSDFEGGDQFLRIQCSDYVTKIFTPCGSQTVIQTYDSRVNGTVFQCKKNKLNLRLEDGFLNITSYDGSEKQSNFPFEFTRNISQGLCVEDRHSAFVFVLRNGSVFSISLATGELSMLSLSSCNDSKYDRRQCFNVRYTGVKNTIAVYDYRKSELLLTNFTCTQYVAIGPQPHFAAFVAGKGESHCQCRRQVVDGSDSRPLPPGGIAGLGVGVGLIFAAMVVAVIAVVCWLYR